MFGVVVSISYRIDTGEFEGTLVPVDLLQVGDEAVPWLVGQPVLLDGVYTASLPDLLYMKGRA